MKLALVSMAGQLALRAIWSAAWSRADDPELPMTRADWTRPSRLIVRASRTVPCSPLRPRRFRIMSVQAPKPGRAGARAPPPTPKRSRPVRRPRGTPLRRAGRRAGARRRRFMLPFHHRLRDFLFDFLRLRFRLMRRHQHDVRVSARARAPAPESSAAARPPRAAPRSFGVPG